MRPLLRALAVTCVTLPLAVPTAHAEEQTVASQRWQSGMDRKGLARTHSGALLDHLDIDVNLWGNYERNPLVLRSRTESWIAPLSDAPSTINDALPFKKRLAALVGQRVASEATASIGLFNWVQLFGAFPVTVYQDRGAGISTAPLRSERLHQFNLGDPRLGGKVRILRASEQFVDLAFVGQVSIPLGVGFSVVDFDHGPLNIPIPRPDVGVLPRWAQGYTSEGFPTLQPELALSRELLGFFFGGNAGLKLRRPYEFARTNITSEVTLRGGAGFRGKQLADKVPWMKYVPVELGIEATGAIPVNHPYITIPYVTPGAPKDGVTFKLPPPVQGYGPSAELTATAGVDVAFLHPYVGASVAALPGLGTPDWRAFAGLRFSSEWDVIRKALAPRDSDGDGVMDPDDRCKDTPGPKENKGCPVVKRAPRDTDGDGILDPDDECITEPEDQDGVDDEDGCPDADPVPVIEKEPEPDAPRDTDGDGLTDDVDQCPQAPEDKDEFQDEDGCPDPDNDQDGVEDADDRCPMDPEDKDYFQDVDGCPEPDNDEDTIPDVDDRCPLDPEDKDGFEDKDGCPDKDNDQDGIPDERDQCPDKPETYNGNKDDDGCPDKGKTLVKVTRERIQILEKIYFDVNKDVIKPRSFPLLDQVASVLTNARELKVRVEGHTDSDGEDAFNMDLSKRRARSVMNYLLEKGIAAERLSSEGFGETRPVAPNKGKAGKEKNRRVEFVILDEAPLEHHIEVDGDGLPEGGD